MKRISNSILLRAILSTYSTPSIFVKAKPIIFARSIEYLKFSNRNPLRKSNKSFVRKKKKLLRKSFD
jgi:hypothetical protein